MDYTVIGDTVNVASRLVGLAEGQRIIVGEETFQQSKDRIEMCKKGEVMVKSRVEPDICYEVAG